MLTCFSEICMPYHIAMVNKDEWLIYNREYRPLGITIQQWDKKDYIYKMKIPVKFLVKLKCYSDRPGMHWFYDDISNPKRLKKNQDKYLALIREFLSIKMENTNDKDS